MIFSFLKRHRYILWLVQDYTRVCSDLDIRPQMLEISPTRFDDTQKQKTDSGTRPTIFEHMKFTRAFFSTRHLRRLSSRLCRCSRDNQTHLH